MAVSGKAITLPSIGGAKKLTCLSRTFKPQKRTILDVYINFDVYIKNLVSKAI